MEFADISEDIVHEIVKYLPVVHKVNVERVSQTFGRVSNYQLLKQKAIAVNVKSDLQAENDGAKATQRCGHAHHKINSNIDVITTKKGAVAIRKLVIKCPNLVAVYINHVANLSVLKKLTKLEHISIDNLHAPIKRNMLQRPELTCLEIPRFCNVTINSFPSLTYFNCRPHRFVFKKLADDNIVAFLYDIEHREIIYVSVADMCSNLKSVYNTCNLTHLQKRLQLLQKQIQKIADSLQV